MQDNDWKEQFNEQAKKMGFEQAVGVAYYMADPRFSGALGEGATEDALILLDNLYARRLPGAAGDFQNGLLKATPPLDEQIALDRQNYPSGDGQLRKDTLKDLAGAKSLARSLLLTLAENGDMPPRDQMYMLHHARRLMQEAAVCHDRLSRLSPLAPEQQKGITP